jgi:hypothetical protein
MAAHYAVCRPENFGQTLKIFKPPSPEETVAKKEAKKI